MPRRPSDPAPKRRPRNSGSVGTRRDGRVFCTLPPDLDSRRRPIYSPPGTRRAFTSVEAATAWLDREVVARRNPAPVPTGAEEPLGAYLARWHRNHTPLWGAQRTVRAYRRSLALMVTVGELGNVPVGAVTHEAVRGALRRLLEATWQRKRRDGTPTTAPRPYSRRTVQHARMTLGLALDDLVPDTLAHNPVRRARLPRSQPPEQPVWDGDQADRFLDAAERLCPHLALAFRLILRRALRRGEVLSLQWKDVDERRGVLTVERTIGERAGETGPTKGRRRREIPLSGELVAQLSAHKRQQSNPSPWVFLNTETDRPYHPRILSWWVPQLARAAGVPPIQPKDMRATCASNLLSDGVPLPTVSQLLGHSSIAVTSAFYERIIKRRQAQISQVADQLDAALDRSAESARADQPRPIRRAE